MRISTSMIFDSAVTNMQNQTTSLMHTQQQIATGNRLVSPSDDPAAAAQALQVTQAKAVNAQYASNQGSATSTLQLEDGQLQSAGDLIQYVRDRVVQANSGALTDSDRASIATDIKSQFDQLTGIANSTDGMGQFMFAGNKGGTQPFTNASISNAAVVTYQGDNGQRALQVSSSRQLPVNDAGSSVFLGNASVTPPTVTNPSGTAGITSVSVDNTDAYSGHNYQVSFSTPTSYTVTDNSVTPATVSAPTAFTASPAGTSITVGGATLNITGSPAANDTFNVSNSGGNPGIFNTLANIYNALTTPTSGVTGALASVQSQLSTSLGDLDAAQNRVLNTRASVGSRMNEVTALGTANSDLDVQYAQILSNLQDTDYTKAISQLSQQQVGLQAAQKSFVQVSGLSLFNFIQ